MMVDWIQSPWTQPFGRRDLDEDPLRLVDLPFAFSDADAFLARCRLLLGHGRRRDARREVVRGRERARWAGKKKAERRREC